MIYPSLTAAQMKRSQIFLIGFNLLNGISYLCVGNMIMLLLVNRLGVHDTIITIWHSLFNIGYIWLPIGKIATEKWGAARTESNFWILRNIAVVAMASCAIWGYFGHLYIACAFLLGGAFFFYGCRSAGCVMATALVGNITTPEDRGKLLAFNSMAHNITAAVLSIALAILTHYSKSLWTLYSIVIFGAACGILAALSIRKVDESEAIRQAAKKPLIADAWVCLKNSAFRRMVVAQVCASVAMALTTALNMVVLTRGYKISDSLAIIVNFVSTFAIIAVARPVSMMGDKFGPRKALIVGYCFFFIVILFWQIVPDTFCQTNPLHWGVLLVLFFLSSTASGSCGICHSQYFLKCVPVEHQPSALTLQALLNGTLTFAFSNAIAPLLWKICDRYLGTDLNMTRYRVFFLLAMPFIGLGFIGMLRQKEV